MKKYFHTLTICLLFFAWILPSVPVQAGPLSLPRFQEASPTPEIITTTPEPAIPSPADIINVVNNLRIANGLNVLSVHPVLMEVAAQQASGIANGMPGHWRPNGLTLGQWLLSLGYPLSGDLALDGYRSENWFYMSTSTTMDEIITSWQGDAEHRETMFSEFRSDIGASIAITPDGEVVAVLETALQTRSGLMQYGASAMLTGIVQTQAAYSGMETFAAEHGLSPQYLVPIAISTARPDGDVVHEVQYGQSLWSLSDMYHISVDEIKRLNGLIDDTVVPGWKLLIQKSATQPAPPTPTFILNTPNQTQAAFPTLTLTATPILTPTFNDTDVLVQSFGQNRLVVVALIISFSVLIAGVVGFGKQKE